MKRILPPAEGEALKLGPPASGEVVIKVDPSRSGAPFAAGTETLLPGAEIPVHRHLHQEEILFVHKGQGRATLEGEAMTVVPGAMIYAPKQVWHGLRNTGTGLLQVTWLSAPAGIQEFFRELARSGASAQGAVLQEIAQRHGIELRPDTAEPMPAPTGPGRGRRRRRRGGRGRRGTAAPVGQPPQAAAPAAPAIAPAPQPAPAAAGQPPGGGPSTALPGPPFTKAGAGGAPSRAKSRDGGRKRRRRRGRAGPAAQPRPQAAKPAPPSTGRPRREGRRGFRRRVKEVYMGGRWVRVTGEGPVISTESGAPEGGEAESES